MKRFSIMLVTIAVLVASLISLHSHNTAAAMLQAPQIKPTPRPELKIRWLSSVTLNKTTTVGGSVDGDITATVVLLRSAISNLTVNLSLEGALLDEAGILVATAPTSVTIPAGSDRATFRIRTFSSPNTLAALTATVRARYGDERVSANFTVEPLKLASFNILPAGGIGPFTANGTMALNARPAENKTVLLTSSNPVVRFGTVGNAQTSSSVTFTSATPLRTFQVVTGSVSQPTTVTITARLGAQTLTRQITVRPAI
jgi:hypothetical protein